MSLLASQLPTARRLFEGEENDFLAGCHADVVVEAHYANASRFLDEPLEDGTSGLNELSSDLLEEVASLLDGGRQNEVLLGRG